MLSVRALSALAVRRRLVRYAWTTSLTHQHCVDLAAASYYVPKLPGLPDDPISRLHIYAGEIPSDPNAPASNANPDPKVVDPHIFFVLVRARKSADKERLVFWFNGGPGCSSFDGLMMEIGPWRVDNKGGLKYTEGGWEEYANVVFVDQPPGTGFSYTSSDKFVMSSLKYMSAHVVQFMRTFYDIFPEFKNMDTYLSGESYAGQYIPYIADAILNSNLGTPLKGVAIGNGWIDPPTQYKAYIDFALAKNLVKSGSLEYNQAMDIWKRCESQISSMKVMPTGLNECEHLMATLTEGLQRKIDGKQVCMNVYDIRLVDEYPACGMNWPPDLADIKPYLRRKDVVNALHAGAKDEAWQECNGRVGGALRNRNSAASITLLPSLLDKIDIMLFAGDQDYICNHVGIESLIENMSWAGSKGFNGAQTSDWAVNGSAAGTWTESRRLTYVKVYNSSHMVPYDVPHVAHDMMLRFMGVDFAAVASGSANIPSTVGNATKPVVKPLTNVAAEKPDTASTKSPEEQKAMWDAYYNAGSVVLVLALIGLGLGLYFFCRNRRRRLGYTNGMRSIPDDEENIPLAQSDSLREKNETDDEWRARKGKGRADSGPQKVVFDVGDDEDDEDGRPARPS
ncbi:alpha/beta-hydrolase [Auriculariales sp. MPI-PUGE-AT-0066]|nr:alpha/beta-hydrolase [Auriculariales sp. MPI-PUGE-AT-0066]